MADQRIRQASTIVDATTQTQGAVVDVSGNLQVKVGAALPAGTNVLGHVIIDTLPSGTQAAATAKTSDFDTGAGTDTVAMQGIALPASGGAVVGGTATNPVRVDVTGTTAQPITDNGGSITVDGTVAVSGSVDTELPAAAALTDATTNPTVPGVGAFAHGFNGTTWDRVKTANTGRLQVDVVTGGGTDSPTNPVTEALTSSAVAAGASVNLDSQDVPAKYLWQVDVTSSVPWKATVSKLDNASLTTLVVLFGRAGEAKTWAPKHRNFAQAPAAGTGTQGWRVAFQNLDTSEAADAYASLEYADN